MSLKDSLDNKEWELLEDDDDDMWNDNGTKDPWNDDEEWDKENDEDSEKDDEEWDDFDDFDE